MHSPEQAAEDDGAQPLRQVGPTEAGEQLQRKIRAAISLLNDRDQVIAGTCREQVRAWGELARPILEEQLNGTDPHAAVLAGRMLKQLDLDAWVRKVRRFAAAVPRKGLMSWRDLERGAALVSSLGRPDVVGVANLAETLDAFAAELEPKLVDKSTMTGARLLAGYLSRELGFDGTRSSFYEPAHIHFDKVVGVRRGVPVALALVYILVGRRAGLEVAGVAIPDHFLVRVHGPRPVLLDPYHEGRQVTKADCVRYLRQAGYGLHTNSYLEDVHDRQVLDTLLRDQARVYGYREDHEICSSIETARQSLLQA